MANQKKPTYKNNYAFIIVLILFHVIYIHVFLTFSDLLQLQELKSPPFSLQLIPELGGKVGLTLSVFMHILCAVQ